jgi:hypothetical protein
MPNEEDPRAKPLCPLAKKIERKLVKKQRKAWNTTCGVYIGEVVGHLDDFSLITERLLIDNAYMTDEHRRARIELKGLLKEFDGALKGVQKRFTGEKEVEEPLENKVKLEEVDCESLENTVMVGVDEHDGVVPIPLAPGWFGAGQGAEEKAPPTSDAEMPDAVPIKLAPGWLRATSSGLG